VDYIAIDGLTFTIAAGEQNITIPVDLIATNIVGVALQFTAVINDGTSEDTATGVRAKANAALFSISSSYTGEIVEGDSYTMTVTCDSDIQAGDITMYLESGELPGCDANCALAGRDYVAEEFIVTWTADGSGMVSAGAESTAFTVQTLVDPTSAVTQKFAVTAFEMSPATINYDNASYFNKELHIITVDAAPWVSNWNCPPPFKYLGEGQSELPMTFTTVDTVQYGFLLPVYQDLKGCFNPENQIALEVLPKAGDPLEIVDGVLFVDFKKFDPSSFNPFDYWLTVYATDTVTNDTSSFRATLKVALTNVQTIAEIQANVENRERSIGDYYVYQMRVPKTLIDYESCKRVEGSNKRLSVDPSCCTTQKVLGGDRELYPDGNSNVEILTCYVLPIVDFYFYELIFDVQAKAPGKSTACVGSTVTDPVGQCFELYSFGVQSMNMIPDQYVAMDGQAWSINLPIVISGEREYRYTLEFVHDEGVSVATAGEASFDEITVSGSTSGAFQVSVISRAIAQVDHSATKGRTFWVYVFSF